MYPEGELGVTGPLHLLLPGVLIKSLVFILTHFSVCVWGQVAEPSLLMLPDAALASEMTGAGFRANDKLPARFLTFALLSSALCGQPRAGGEQGNLMFIR